MNSGNSPQLLRGSLEKLLESLGSPEIDAVKALIDQWPQVVGPELATRIRAVAVRESELIVHVEDPAWASQISWLEETLMERISSLIGSGRILRVRARLVRPRQT